MKGIASIAPLAERKLSAIIWLYMFPLFALAPILFQFDQGPTVSVAQQLYDALYRETIIIPACAGMFFGMCMNEVRALPFSWSLPGLRRGYTIGSLQILAAFMVLAGALHVASGTNVLCGVAIATMSFCTPLVISHRGTPWVGRLYVLVLLVIGAIPGLLDLWPFAKFVVVAGAIVEVPWLVYVMQSADRHRETARAPRFREVPRLFGALRKDRAEYLPVRLRRRNALDWARASHRVMEASGVNSLSSAIAAITILVVLAYFFGDPNVLVTFCLVMAWQSPTTALQDGNAYPLSRRTRADARFLLTVSGMWFRCAVAAAVAAPLFAIKPLPQFLSLGIHPDMTVLPELAALLIWVPALQWSSTRPPAPQQPMIGAAKTGFYVRTIPAMAIVMILVATTDLFATRHLKGATIPERVGLFIVAAAITHCTYLVMLRRSYRRNDLV